MFRGRLKNPAWLKYAAAVAIIHLTGIILLLVNSRQYPQLIGLGFVAYTLGLRHAFDADHIAAIDNVVRKLVQQKKKPLGVGFFFSIGHSSVVFIMALVTTFSMKWAQDNIPYLKDTGKLVGTAVSGLFLIVIGLVNLFIWFEVFILFKNVNKSGYNNDQLDEILLKRGFISRFLGPFYRRINKSWHVYPLGFLFGLGFDTASEIALLAISASLVTQVVPLSAIISLPIIFAAGMSLMDTADGIFMTTAYNWAFSTPLRKLYYNLTVTGLSVVAALVIGSIELLQLLTLKLELRDGVWKWIQGLDLGGIGYLLAGLFVVSWLFSYILWKILRLEKAQKSKKNDREDTP